MRERRLPAIVIVVALAAAGGLIGWSSIAAALSQESNVRLRLGELPSDERSLQVVYHLAPGESDGLLPDSPVGAAPATRSRSAAVGRFFDEFADVVPTRRSVQLWHSLGPGLRVFVADDMDAAMAVTRGRLPAGCRHGMCEALALAGDLGLRERVPLGAGAALRIVGFGSFRREALPEGSEALPRTPELGTTAVLVRSLGAPLEPLTRETGSSVVTTASFDAKALHGSELRALGARLHRQTVRLQRTGDFEVTAPVSLLENLADRGDVAAERLLLIAGQGAALVVAFAAFAASARREESRLLDEQLATLGASRTQIGITRIVETAVPSLVGGLVALGGLRFAVYLVARRRDLPSTFAATALPPETVVAIATVSMGAALLLLAAFSPQRRSRFGIGPLELAAGAALALVVWQTATTGALDPDRIEAGERAGPVVLLLPALAFFATGVALLRVLPPALRLAEHASRAAPLAIRLAFLTAARSPGQAAAATTFLAIAIGSALFGLNYRATLERQGRDEARFAAGALWRIAERADAADLPRPGRRAPIGGDTGVFTGADVEPLTGSSDVTPLTRFARASSERPTPVLRLEGRVREAVRAGREQPVEILAVPAGRIPDLSGWREGFSTLARTEIVRRLRPSSVRLAGPRLAPDSRVVRVWARADTRLPRFVIAHFLLPGEQRFAHVRVGTLTPGWRRLYLRIRRSLRGAELVAIEFPPVFVPFSSPPDLGFVRLGRFEQRRAGGWSALPALDGWTATAAGGSVESFAFRDGPVGGPVEFSVRDTPLALMHAPIPLPRALPGLASRSVAAAAVDGLVTLDVQGKELPVRVAGSATYFPTVVGTPTSFVVLDYGTLFAALNADQPGLALPSEAWFFRPQPTGFLERLSRPPFRVEAAVGADPLEARLLSDPLAAGARGVLGVAALAAAALGLLGLVLAARSALASERLLLAEYEALGVPPATLARSTQLRLLAISALGVAAGVLGALLAVRLVTAFVAVTGTAARPLPPIEPAIAWRVGGAMLVAVAVANVVAAALLAGQALRETAGRRLRA
jgi:hypothetical protein